ncbi:MAG TPA: AAA family ATPase [Terriglobales bacterium]|nr:AAA family ATPase [Terriglobales bacterium]
MKRFHSIFLERVELSNPTLVVGCNGSGKSNLVDVFAFLSEITELPLQTVIDRRGGVYSLVARRPGERLMPRSRAGEWFLVSGSETVEPVLGIRAEFENLPGPRSGNQHGHFAFELRMLSRYTYRVLREQCAIHGPDGTSWYDRGEGSLESNVEFLKGFKPKFLSPSSLIFHVVGGIYPFFFVQQFLKAMTVYSIDPARLRNMQDPDIGTSLRSNGSNATSVLAEILEQSPEDGQRICEVLAAISPGMKRVFRVRQGKQLSLRFVQEWGEKKTLDFDAFSMSDGTLRALGLILAVYQHYKPSVIVIEEPEASIHPGALGVILDILRHAAKEMQVVITTHSPDVLDAKWVREESLRMVTVEDGITRVSGLSEFSLTALREHLMGAGELLRSNSLEPAPPPLFDELDSRQVSLFE